MPKFTEDKNGYITIPNNPISKAGVFEYLGREISSDLEPDKIYKVWRPEEELNNPATIESFKLSPWIPLHEMLGEGFTAPEEVGIQGVTGEDVYFDGDTLFANLRLYGESLKKAIRAGLSELSCGFRCMWEIASGTTPSGEAYDVVQRDIRGNHLASVEEGRMGQQVAVAMDRATFALDNLSIKTKGDLMTLEELKAAIAQALAEGGLAPEEMQALKDYLAETLGGQAANEETAEDEEKAEDQETAEDAESEEEKAEGESKAMDAKFKALEAKFKRLEASAMDEKSVIKMINSKNSLVSKVTPIIGAFDHSLMSEKEVAAYSLKKMGIACDSGAELSTLKGALAVWSKPATTVDHGMDSKSTDADANKILSEMGIL